MPRWLIIYLALQVPLGIVVGRFIRKGMSGECGSEDALHRGTIGGTIMRTCRFCGKKGDWPSVCMSTRDMEEKPYNPRCWQALMECGGGERTVNQIAAQKQSIQDKGTL